MSARKALAYYRTSSATNVGTDKDSLARQKAAVTAYAKANKITVADEFYDTAVSGADPIEARPGFLNMLGRIAGNGVRCIGRKGYAETAPELVEQVRNLRRGGLTLDQIGITLQVQGQLNSAGRRFAPTQVARMLRPEDNRIGRQAN